jgi:hypothetical protein
MATIQRIHLHEVRHHLKQRCTRSRFSKIYMDAYNMMDAKVYKLVCEAVNAGINAGIYARYDKAPLSKEVK